MPTAILFSREDTWHFTSCDCRKESRWALLPAPQLPPPQGIIPPGPDSTVLYVADSVYYYRLGSVSLTVSNEDDFLPFLLQFRLCEQSEITTDLGCKAEGEDRTG